MHTCRVCNEETHGLYAMPGDSFRTACGKCQGKANREICDRMAEAVRVLKLRADQPSEAYLRSQDYGDTVTVLAKARAAAANAPQETPKKRSFR